ncbi:hypothetical protein FOCC_FOCC006461 [Frankliniella occidentalis]|nr:hypothetical protein FOCC_FOCC006461 [Frankliniella occidentalis]
METEIKRMETEESKASAAKKISTTPSPTMGNFLGRRSACVTQAEANSAIAAYIVQEMEPVSKVESAGLKNLVSVLTKGNSIPIYCPTRKGMNKMISDTYDEMMASVKKLHGVDGPYNTIDTTTLARISYGVACKRIKYSHDFKNIATVLHGIHKDLGIDKKGKIVKCITGDASNFAKAFRIFTLTDGLAGNSEPQVNDEDEDEIIYPDIDFIDALFTAGDEIDFLSDDFVTLPPKRDVSPIQ